MLWRLTEDNKQWLDLWEGSCITDSSYRSLDYRDRPLFEPITDEDKKVMIEVSNKEYTSGRGIEKLLFWNPQEVVNFNKKLENGN